MGWVGSLVVLVVSIGLPEQGAYQLLPMLPFVLPLFAVWFSRDGEASEGTERRGRKKKNKEVWAAYFTSQVFLPLVALVYLLVNPVVQDVVLQSGQSSERSAIATILTITPSRRIPSMLGMRRLPLSRKRSFGGICFIDPNFLSGDK